MVERILIIALFVLMLVAILTVHSIWYYALHGYVWWLH